MGILNELRDEAERKKIIDQQQVISAEQLAENYQQNILPKMQLIFDFFKEIVEHLQFIKDPIKVIDYSKKYPELGELIQQDYKLSTDKHGGISHYHDLKDIKVRFYCVGEGSMELAVKSQAEIEQQVNYLTAKKEIFNHHNFGHIKRNYNPEEINDAFLDQVAKFLLRKDNDFIEIEMTEQEREALRENLRKNINFDNNPNINQQSKQKKPQGLLGKMTSLFKSK